MCSPEVSYCAGTNDLGLARFVPTDGDAPTPPDTVPFLPPLSATLTVTTATQVSSTQGDAVTVPIGSAPVIETTVGSALTGAEVYLDGIGWQPMTAVDGTLDSPAEAVRATLPALTPAGIRTVCVRAVAGLDRSSAGCVPLKVAETLKFGGFAQPAVGLPTLNTMKAGAAVPVKFRLGGNFGLMCSQAGRRAQRLWPATRRPQSIPRSRRSRRVRVACSTTRPAGCTPTCGRQTGRGQGRVGSSR